MNDPAQNDPPSRMRVGFKIRYLDREKLRYIKQLGVDDVVYLHKVSGADRLPLPEEGLWSVDDLRRLRDRIESEGLRLHAVSNLPYSMLDDVMLGKPRRDERLARLKELVRNVGRAGIDLLGYYWWPGGVTNDIVRTDWEQQTRGGAQVSAFDLEQLGDVPTLLDREYSESELWDNYEYFLEEILPVAESAGVKLALHPTDPPVESVGGVPFLFRDFDGFQRAMDAVPSPNHGLLLGLGCWSQMGADVESVIRHFGRRDEIFYVHLRDVVGIVPKFKETFLEEGNFDEREVLRALRDVGYSGVLLPDHTPILEGDTDWDGFIGGYRGRAHATGYIQGLLAELYRDD